jgi:hypothetical protein
MTQTATITPHYVNPPKPGNFSGWVKDASGTCWGVKPEMLHLFQPGQSVTIEYDTVTRNGKTFHNVKGVLGHAAPATVPQYAPQPQTYAPPPPPPPPPAPQPSVPAPVAGPPGTYFKERTMFIMACMKALSADRGPADIKLFALAANEAWDQLEKVWGKF